MIKEQVRAEVVTRRVSAVLFVDVVDSVRLIQQDAEGTVSRWREFVAASQHDLPAMGGRIVKHTGDGMLVEFDTIFDAVRAALAMQARMERGSSALPEARRLRQRMGVHVTDVIADDMDL
jgi:class 3 adenylate cyclase